MRRLALLTAALALLAACTEKTDLRSDGEYTEYLAVDATLTDRPDRPQQVVLSRTVPYFGDAEAHASFRTQGVLMGYSQAAGIAAALCIQENCQPRKMKAERIQRQLMHFDASPFRDDARRTAEKKKADEAVLQFLRSHPDNITEGKYLKPYLDMMKAAAETK